MEKVSLPIFEPNEAEFQLTYNWIVVCIAILVGVLLWVFDNYFSVHSDSRALLAFGCGIIVIGIQWVSFFQFQPLNGKLNGEIIFDDDSLVANDVMYKLEKIKKLDFRFVDFYGERSIFARDFNPKLRQGVRNFVSFIDDADQAHKIYFQLLGKEQYVDLYPFINKAVKAGAMTYYRAIDLIDVENVTKPQS